MEKVTVMGQATKEGYGIYGIQQVREFCRRNLGKRITVTLEVVPDDASERQTIFYEKIILPAIQQGIYESGTDLDLQDIDLFMRSNSGVHDKDKNSMIRHIEFCLQWAAEHLQIDIKG
jgi:hypothetical protein